MTHTRRAFLGTTAAVGIGTVAGCLSSEDPPDPPVTGDPDADVTVTVYEDFACPFCRDFKLGVFPELEELYTDPGEIRYEHRDFPLPVDETWSWAVSSAGREIFETDGDDEFWSFTSEIYEHQHQHQQAYNYDVIERVADDVGADGAAVREAAEEESNRSAIEDDRSYGESNGVDGTPTIVVDGDQVELVDSEDFEAMAFDRTTEAIENALE